jgi:uncharacterized protein YdeI (YjbR/CyaY-like superfamily)
VTAVAVKRDLQPMPDFGAEALEARGLRDTAHEARLPYRRNDDLAWINRAKRQETQDRRLARKQAKLAAGEGYRTMPLRPKA